MVSIAVKATPWTVGVILLTVFTASAGRPPRAAAQSPSEAIEAYADSWARDKFDRTGGRAVDWPMETPRPATEWRLDDPSSPNSVHGARGIEGDLGARALEMLVRASRQISMLGWSSPLADGGRGGTAGFDLYLTAQPGETSEARADGPSSISPLDGDIGYGVVNVSDPHFEACIAAAYAEAVLLGTDPGEAPSLRRGTAEWLAIKVTGDTDGCWGGMELAARTSSLAWYDDVESSPNAASALLWEMLALRYGDDVVRDLWDFARQRTPAGTPLRGEPDLFQAFEKYLAINGDHISDAFEDLAVDRWFASPPDAREAGLLADIRYADLPEHSAASENPIEPWATEFARVEVGDMPANGRLRIWSEGEFGVTWSLAAVRLDEHGRELGRISAPPIARKTRAYVLLDILPGTQSVLLAVTNLGPPHLPDPDLPSVYGRSAHFIVDRDLGNNSAQ